MSTKTYDAEVAKRIDDTCQTGDAEADHGRADDIVLDLLREFGYTATAAAWERVDKWYA